MPIDDCKHTFLELTKTVLPAHMRRMRDAMGQPVQAAIFAQTRQGPRAIAKQLHRPDDFAGCYVFMEHARPIYTGISRKVLSRIRQHLCGKTHFDASLSNRNFLFTVSIYTVNTTGQIARRTAFSTNALVPYRGVKEMFPNLGQMEMILIMGLGAMAMANRVSWGWCLAAILGIAIAFGAPQIVTWVRGMFGV